MWQCVPMCLGFQSRTKCTGPSPYRNEKNMVGKISLEEEREIRTEMWYSLKIFLSSYCHFYFLFISVHFVKNLSYLTPNTIHAHTRHTLPLSCSNRSFFYFLCFWEQHCQLSKYEDLSLDPVPHPVPLTQFLTLCLCPNVWLRIVIPYSSRWAPPSSSLVIQVPPNFPA